MLVPKHESEIKEEATASAPADPLSQGSSISRARARTAALHRSGRLRHWVTTLTKFFSWEILNQLLRMVSALIIVRYLTKNEYAWYSLSNSCWGAVSLFSITGAGTGLLTLGGESLKDPQRFGEVLKAASKFRLALLAIGIPVAFPLFGYLLHKNGCQPLQVAVLLLLALVVLLLDVSGQMAAAILSLRRAYNIPQKAESLTMVMRTALLVGILALGFLKPSTILLITATSAALSLWFFLLPKLHLENLPLKTQISPIVRSRFFKLTLNGLPATLTLVFQGQIAMVLLAWFGNSGNVASFGALSRLGMLVSVPMALSTKILIPRLASEPDARHRLHLWMGGLAYAMALAAVLIAASFFFADEMLWLLGGRYNALTGELSLFAGSLALSSISYQIATISMARGWLRHSWVRPIVVILCQIAAISMVDVSTLRGAILLTYASAAGNCLVEILLVVRGFRGVGGI